MNEQRIAFDLLSRLHALTGPTTVDQVDLVLCEDNETYMAYLYDAANNCVPLCFDIPPGGVDPDALTAALEAQGTRH